MFHQNDEINVPVNFLLFRDESFAVLYCQCWNFRKNDDNFVQVHLSNFCKGGHSGRCICPRVIHYMFMHIIMTHWPGTVSLFASLIINEIFLLPASCHRLRSDDPWLTDHVVERKNTYTCGYVVMWLFVPVYKIMSIASGWLICPKGCVSSLNKSHPISARLQYLQCVSNGDTAVLH